VDFEPPFCYCCCLSLEHTHTLSLSPPSFNLVKNI
jgi:hypothetical protein